MALTIESGEIVAGANSYATVSELRAYAALRGATVPTSDAACEALLIKAMDYLADQRYQGERVTADQPLDWPRTGAWVENWPIASNAIPRQLVQAQCALAIEAQSVDLMPTQDLQQGGTITSETVGPVSVTYANTGNVRRVPAIAKADALLRTLLRRNGFAVVRA